MAFLLSQQTCVQQHLSAAAFGGLDSRILHSALPPRAYRQPCLLPTEKIGFKRFG